MIPRPVVRHELVRMEAIIPNQELHFVCQFPPKGNVYYYQVIWYIEDEPVVIKDPVKMDAIQQTNLGYNQDPSKGYTKLGINVRNNGPCELKRQNWFSFSIWYIVYILSFWFIWYFFPMHYLYIQYSKDLNSVHSSKKKTPWIYLN